MKGWIDKLKDSSVLRLFAINPHGFGLDNEEKMYQLKEKLKEF